MSRGTALGAALAALVLACAGRPAAAQTADTVRGRVLGTDSLPVSGAEVTVRSARTLAVRRTVSDAEGRWRVAFPDTSHAYEVAVRRMGKTPARLRVSRTVGGLGAAAAVLADAPLALEGVTAVGGRRPPVITSGPGGDRLPHERSAAQTWDGGDQTRFDRGELDAVAALGNGATVLDGGGVSVGGLSPDQNAFRIDGLSFGGRALPRLGAGLGYGTSQSADPSRGGFSGGEVRASLVEGHFQSPELAVAVRGSDPRLQTAGAAAPGLARHYRDLEVGIGFQAGVLDQRAGVAVSADLHRRTTPATSPLAGGAAGALGVAPDSLARLRAIMERLGVPATVGGVPDDVSREGVNVLANVGLHRLFGGIEGAVHLQADRTTEAPLGTGPSIFPAAGREARDGGMNAGASLRKSFANGFLHEAGIVWDARDSRAAPYSFLPGASVRVASALEGGERPVAALRFGGGGGAAESRTSFWEASYRVRWNSVDERHQRSVGAEARSEGYREHAEADGGAFAFASLADLEAGRPSSFTRMLGERDRRGRLLTGALYAEDVFRPSERLELRLGLRAEGLAGARVGAANPAVEERFGGRTGRLPGEVAVSPRIGFAWSPAPGLAGRGRFPYGTLSGSAGLFRDRPSPAEAVALGGEDGTDGSRVVSCVGGAVPAPAWDAWLSDPAAIPSACVGGGGAEDGGTPWVSYFDREYRAARAWKAGLRWSGRIPVPSLARGDLRLTLEAQYTRGTHQPSGRDANLSSSHRFSLTDEGGRPVFVPAAAVVEATGAVPLDASRIDPAFGVVGERRSDGAVDTRQLTVRLAPHLSNYGRFRYELAYTRSFSRSLARGFDGLAAGGDPSRLEWRPNPFQADHVVQGWLSLPLWRSEAGSSVALHLVGRAQSGLPFTPEVVGDVNGDGAPNDAAFVFDPAAAPDPALAEGMRRLLDDAPEGVRKCLGRQLGRIAAPGSCAGPWTADLRAELLSHVAFPVGRGVTLALRADNVLGGIDRLLHGAGGRRGWGDPAAVDRTLLIARGFDPIGRRFQYDVNPRFSDASAARDLYRRPFVVELSASFTLGKSWPHVATDQLAFALRRDAPTAGDTLATLAGFVRPVNPMRHTLRFNADRLLLTSEQSVALETMADAFEAAVDSATSETVAYLGAAVGSEPSGRITRRVRPAREAGDALRAAYLRCMKAVLSADQWALLDDGWTREADEHRAAPDAPAPACPADAPAPRQ